MSEITWNRVVTAFYGPWKESRDNPRHGFCEDIQRYSAGERSSSVDISGRYEGKIACELRGETLFIAYAGHLDYHDHILDRFSQLYNDAETDNQLRKDPSWASSEIRWRGGAFFWLDRDMKLSVGGASERLGAGLTPVMLQAAANHLISFMAGLGVTLTQR